MKHSKRYRSVQTLMAEATLVPLGLSMVATALAWTRTSQSSYDGWVVAALLALALLSAVKLYMRNLRATLDPIEQATRCVKSLAWGRSLPALKFPHVNETSELLVAIQELGDYLVVMLPQDDDDEASSPRAGTPKSQDQGLEELLINLRQTCDQLSQWSDAPAPVAAEQEAPAGKDANRSPVAEEPLRALRQQADRLLQVASLFPSRVGRTRLGHMSQWATGT
jgi:hypothetical protein